MLYRLASRVVGSVDLVGERSRGVLRRAEAKFIGGLPGWASELVREVEDGQGKFGLAGKEGAAVYRQP